MTPNDIEVLLHYHTRGEPHPRIDAPAVEKATAMLQHNNLIEPGRGDFEGTYITTERGKAHVTQLCSLPFPTQQWADQNGKVIKGRL